VTRSYLRQRKTVFVVGRPPPRPCRARQPLRSLSGRMRLSHSRGSEAGPSPAASRGLASAQTQGPMQNGRLMGRLGKKIPQTSCPPPFDDQRAHSLQPFGETEQVVTRSGARGLDTLVRGWTDDLSIRVVGRGNPAQTSLEQVTKSGKPLSRPPASWFGKKRRGSAKRPRDVSSARSSTLMRRRPAQDSGVIQPWATVTPKEPCGIQGRRDFLRSAPRSVRNQPRKGLTRLADSGCPKYEGGRPYGNQTGKRNTIPMRAGRFGARRKIGPVRSQMSDATGRSIPGEGGDEVEDSQRMVDIPEPARVVENARAGGRGHRRPRLRPRVEQNGPATRCEWSQPKVISGLAHQEEAGVRGC